MNIGELVVIVCLFVLILIQRYRVIILEKKLDIAIDVIIKDNNETKDVFADRINRNRCMVELLAKKQGYTFVDESEENEND